MKFQFLYEGHCPDRETLQKKIFDVLTEESAVDCPSSDGALRLGLETRNSKKIDYSETEFAMTNQAEELKSSEVQCSDSFTEDSEDDADYDYNEESENSEDSEDNEDSEDSEDSEYSENNRSPVTESELSELINVESMLKTIESHRIKLMEENDKITSLHPQKNKWLTMPEEEQTKTALRAVDKTFVLHFEAIVEVRVNM